METKDVRRFLVRLVVSVTRRSDESGLREEIRQHLALQTTENIKAGLPPDEARRQAILKFGAVEATVEEYRHRRGLPALEHVVQDVRYAIRSLRKHPVFTCVAVSTLALGIAANVSIFAFVDAALLTPLPYDRPSQLVTAFGLRSDASSRQMRGMVSYLDFLDWRDRNQVFSSIAAYDVRAGFTLLDPAGAQRVPGLRVTSGFFRTLGVVPILGREFRRDEEGPAAPATIMLAYSAWQSRYGGRPDIVGQTVPLQSGPHTVIGVLPRNFQFPMADQAEYWAAIRGRQPCWELRGCRSLETIARLANGISVQSATASLSELIRSAGRDSRTNDQDSAKLVPLHEVIFRDLRPVMLMLLGGAILLLVIASINVVNLLLTRSDARQREIAIQRALGVASGRLVSRFGAEAFVLVAASGACGLMLTTLVTRLAGGLLGGEVLSRMPYLADVGVNPRMGVFTAAISLIALIVFTVTPLARIGVSESLSELKESSRGSAGVTWRRFGRSLVIAELAIAIVLLVCAGLFGKSAFRLVHGDVGFLPDDLLTLSIAPSGGNVNEPAGNLARQVAERVAGITGVQSVAYADLLPLARGLAPSSGFQVEGAPLEEPVEDHPVRRISSGYFTTLQARFLHGRDFTEREVAANTPAVIINQTAARRYFQNLDPVGRRITIGAPPAREIVGVVADIKDGPPETPPHPSAYIPFDQVAFNIVIRTTQSQPTLASVASAIREVRSTMLIQGASTMGARLNALPSTSQQRATAWVIGGFALLALVLSVVGLYGVISYAVGQRTREIGVRMALGAHRQSVYQLVVGDAALLVAVGTIVGLVATFAATLLIRRLLFGIQPWDAAILASATAVLALSALFASYFPARRAARIDPLVALRYE